MCRFIAYLGSPIIADEILLKPENSLVNQSYDAEEMSQTLNGDGFGLGWYVPQVREYPGLFRSITPAWNNQNLLYNSSLIRTGCLFAHIRAASEGAVSEANCHPFHYQQYLMMHNGGIPEFTRIKRSLINLLDEDIYLWIKGQTDTEHIFALIIQMIREKQKTIPPPLSMQQLADCFQSAFDRIEALKTEKGITEMSAFNLMVTDGKRIIGTRYSTHPEIITPTLYYAAGTRFEQVDGISRMIRENEDTNAVLVVSEKLTDVSEDWIPIPPNHFVTVNPDLSISLIPMR